VENTWLMSSSAGFAGKPASEILFQYDTLSLVEILHVCDGDWGVNFAQGQGWKSGASADTSTSS
jgi:hypothetical protein